MTMLSVTLLAKEKNARIKCIHKRHEPRAKRKASPLLLLLYIRAENVNILCQQQLVQWKQRREEKKKKITVTLAADENALRVHLPRRR